MSQIFGKLTTLTTGSVTKKTKKNCGEEINYRYGKPVPVFGQPGVPDGTIVEVHPHQLHTLRLSYPVKENKQTVNAFKAHKRCMQVLFEAIPGITLLPYKLNSNKPLITNIEEFPDDPDKFDDYANYAADNHSRSRLWCFNA